MRAVREDLREVRLHESSTAYLHHLFQVHDPLALRLATIHNLVFYADLMAAIRLDLAPRPPRDGAQGP